MDNNGNHKLPVERYNSHIDTWTTLTCIPQFKKCFEVISFENKIYVISGVYRCYNKETKGLVFKELDRIEIYDPQLNQWTHFDAGQVFPRVHLELC